MTQAIRRWCSYSIKSHIHSISEVKNGESKPVFETAQVPHDTKLFVCSNLPSIYGGASKAIWYNNRTRSAMPKSIISEERLGTQSYSDNKMELMGQDSFFGALFGQIKRFCQVEGPWEVNFKEGLPHD